MGSVVVAIIAIERGHVEGYAQTSFAVLQKEFQPLVGVFGGPEA
jgi:hypothetical protein